jgi:hypothetical protein
MAFEAKKSESSAELAKARCRESARFRKEVTLPINAEMEALANKIVDFAKARGEEARVAAESEALRSSRCRCSPASQLRCS